ncbi:hypothetical protein [Paracnuella aquatica]|uniref:hypothetical protein n=1 Tax=Paracnuella aquatica TaxID=2268757 RepID=UPI000DEFAE26|nr:hypothetical protein [Paracnuella aquatica]RPD43431.1 hypothetical protein DRJ53_20200 [Paracnuella aquatica]
MTITFQIEGQPLVVDCHKTREFYLTQEKIIDDCQCENCQFYAEYFTKEPLEIFSMLSSMGVDLQKNINSEPTGVWCIRDENHNFRHCGQVYQIVGHFPNGSTTEIKYEKVEGNYKITVFFTGAGNDAIDIDLIIDRV